MSICLAIYRGLWVILCPFICMFLLYRRKKGKEDNNRLYERFGIPSQKRPEGKLFWVHAASVGEMLSAFTLIERIQKVSDYKFLLTTGTVSSAGIAMKKNLPGVIHQYVPIDYKPCIDRFFRYWQPDYAVIIESELWPNLIDRCTASQMYLVNARLSDRSFKKWKWLRAFIRKLLKRFSLIMAQTQKDAEHYRYFVNNVLYTGNLKYSTPAPKVDAELLDKVSCWARKYVFVGASTHDGEDLQLINAYSEIIKQLGQENVSLVIIPRHPDRSLKICELIESNGYSVMLRSKLSEEKTDAICVDSFGEMGTFFKIASFTFIGGSFVRVGGHNMFEPVQSGCPVMFGPYTFNFIEMVDFLEKSEVAYCVQNAADIASLFCKYVTSSEFHEHVSQKIQELHGVDPAGDIIKYLNLGKIR